MQATLTQTITPHQAKAERARRATLKRFAAFMHAYPPHKPYYWGRHTTALTAALQSATETVEAGGRCYKIVVMPARHGKSDQASRRFPVWHVLRNPTQKVMIATHSGQLSADMGRPALRLMREIGPMYGCSLSVEQTQAWEVDAGGGMYAVGIGGTITGRGAHILVIDDYLKNREEAESEIVRDKIWDSFRNDLFTRLAEVHAVIIPCTRWHEDDLVGRILRAGEEDPDFPRFELLRFPAWDDEKGWLFPEKFSDEWYRTQKAAQGSYAWQALSQGDPKPRHGNMLRADMIQLVDEMPQNGIWMRGWDLASTEKQRVKDDPDFTVGALISKQNGELWIKDIRRGQWASTKRNRQIVAAAEQDGPGVKLVLETVGGFKDALDEVKELLRKAGLDRIVRPCSPQSDLVARASNVEPTFEAGKVYCLRGAWNAAFQSECAAFPRGRHDDQIAAVLAAVSEFSKTGFSVEIF